MKKKSIITIIVIALIVIILIFVFSFRGTRQVSDSSQENPSIFVVPSVEITSFGFSPKTLEINSGDTVTWTNKDSRNHRPASAIHPTHTIYPGSSINKCGTAEAQNTFDACRELSSGQSYSFTFNEKGSWKYHDHLSPSSTGTIVVN